MLAELDRRNLFCRARWGLFWEVAPPERWEALPPERREQSTRDLAEWRKEREKVLGGLPLEDRRRLEALRYEDFEKEGACEPQESHVNPIAMQDDAMFGEMQRKLEEADALSEEDREMLAGLLGKFPEKLAEMEANPDIGPEERARRREKLRAAWLTCLDSCLKVGVAEGEMLVLQADQADKMRDLTMGTLRIVHAMRKSLDDGTFTGTWEQRESIMETIEEVEEAKSALLEDLTVEDIRQLEDEGVL